MNKSTFPNRFRVVPMGTDGNECGVQDFDEKKDAVAYWEGYGCHRGVAIDWKTGRRYTYRQFTGNLP